MTKKAKAAKKNGRRPKGNRLLRRVVASGLDAMAQSYARLLLDPCNAPLAYPVWGSQGTYLQKFESFLTIDAGATTNSSGFVWWSPGSISATAKSNLVNAGAVNAGTTMTWAGATDLGGFSPGYSFMNGVNRVAGSYRAVAACMEVVPLTTELNRQGFVAAAPVQNSTVYGLDSTANQLFTALSSGSRTPDGKLEVLWRPGHDDAMFQDGSDAISAQQVDRRTGILFAYSGQYAGVASTPQFQIKLTAVYEWTPIRGSGITPPAAAITSRNTLADVLSATAGQAFTRFVGGAGDAAYNIGAAALYGAATAATRARRNRIELR